MKDLSKEKRLEQRISELEHLIAKKDYDFDKEQWKRCKITFFVLSGVIYLIELYCVLDGGISGISIDIICGLLFAPLVAAGFVMFISFGVSFYIMSGATYRAATIAELKGELNTLKSSKYNACEDENTKEIKSKLDDLLELKIWLDPIIEEHHIQKIKERLDKEVEEIEED